MDMFPLTVMLICLYFEDEIKVFLTKNSKSEFIIPEKPEKPKRWWRKS